VAGVIRTKCFFMARGGAAIAAGFFTQRRKDVKVFSRNGATTQSFFTPLLSGYFLGHRIERI